MQGVAERIGAPAIQQPFHTEVTEDARRSRSVSAARNGRHPGRAPCDPLVFILDLRNRKSYSVAGACRSARTTLDRDDLMLRFPAGTRLLPVIISGLLMFCSACASGRPRQKQAIGAGVSGTYSVSICSGACTDSSSAAVRGTLVLDGRPLPLSSVPRSALEYFDSHTFLLMNSEGWGEALNACFVLDRDDSFPGYAGSTPVGLTRWSMEGDSIAVLLDQSADAGYVSRFEIRDGRLSGRGWSGGRGDAAVSLPDDVVLGQRTGPADFGPCFRAAEDQARRPSALR
ncbi:hypothetical protein FHS01_005472 [Longimicrobium terrae]|uniref:Uncharacterized protein n=1 Tax=Longimicrobium terrae TaxID=1639882 RepID=A0A841H6C8_9BACT|nr:hypothetical protein [Longimicrobium terrae]MBB6073711.1 hypothetical protein [Longimicrobium terrae]